mgnify:CR=1 FL=1
MLTDIVKLAAADGCEAWVRVSPVEEPESVALSKALKKRGFAFVRPNTPSLPG